MHATKRSRGYTMNRSPGLQANAGLTQRDREHPRLHLHLYGQFTIGCQSDPDPGGVAVVTVLQYIHNSTNFVSNTAAPNHDSYCRTSSNDNLSQISNLDSSLCRICCYFSVLFLYNLAYLRL